MSQPKEVRLGQQRTPHVVVRRSRRRRRTVTAYRDRDAIVVLVPQAMSHADEQRYVNDLVRKLLAREAKASAPRGDSELVSRAAVLVDRYLLPALGHAVQPSSVTWVTNQSQRWASCTPSAQTIRLSHRLRPMPSWVVDYVLVHELAHLVEPTHSTRFWQLVDTYPAAQQAKGFLEGYLAGQGQPAWDDDSDVT